MAIEFGADMLGFNFYPGSSRFISVDLCREISKEIKTNLPQIILAGIYVNCSTDLIAITQEKCLLDLAQLSGNEPVSDLKSIGESAIKTIHPSSLEEAISLANRYAIRKSEPAFLVDAFSPDFYGGTGKTTNWVMAAELAKSYAIILAGGLKPENVMQAITTVKPWGIDTASGVEISPGIKDPYKLKDFIQIIRSNID